MKNAIPHQIAMSVVLIMIGMLFATLMLGYFVYRFTSDNWPPLGIERPSLIIPFSSTVFILASSFFYKKFEKTLEPKWLNYSFLLGILFLGIQLIFWYHLRDIGLYTQTGTYSSLLHALTWIHAAHVILGLMAFGWPYYYLRQEKLSKSKLEECMSIKNVGTLWHFLGVVWVVLFINLFVL